MHARGQQMDRSRSSRAHELYATLEVAKRRARSLASMQSKAKHEGKGCDQPTVHPSVRQSVHLCICCASVGACASLVDWAARFRRVCASRRRYTTDDVWLRLLETVWANWTRTQVDLDLDVKDLGVVRAAAATLLCCVRCRLVRCRLVL